MIINVNNNGMVGNANEKKLHIELIKKDKEIERLKEELDINNRLINGIENRLKNHFRKIDRFVCDDTNMLIVIEDLIKKAKGKDK